MPQLDFTTTLPQIFWLIVIFFTVYTILVHFFLPNFIRLIKSRKNIILVNEKEINLLENKFIRKQTIVKQIIKRNFVELKVTLEKEFPTFLTTAKVDLTPSDLKLIHVLYYNTLYYDTIILDSILLKPNFSI